MTSTILRRSVRQALLLSSIMAGAVMWAPVQAAEEDKNNADEEVVVTGSRIARPNLESTVPVTSVDAEQIFETGNSSVGDLLNELPALRSTYSQSNSSRFLGTAGLNLLDLRGLGTQRTLVLVNGRRHVGGDILNNAVSPDINTFPSDLIERIDIVTGGSSAVYGSDAIAGVANFILKRNYEGVELRGQGGRSKYGDADSYFASVLYGSNFSDNRGNVAINLEYAKQKPFFASDRPNLAHVGNFVVVDTDPAGLPNGSDGIPDRKFYPDIRFTTIATGGLLQFSPTGTLAPCGRDALNAAFRCTYIFQPDGTLVPQTGTRIGVAPNGNFNGGNGTTGREGQTLGIFPKLDRYSANVIAHFEVTEAFDPFLEAKYVRTDSVRYGSPAFFQGSTIDGFTERPRFDNPFLSDSARATIVAARTAAGITPATPAGTTRLLLFKNLDDLGGRQEEAKRETTRIVAGVGGALSEDWKYEASVNWGKFKESTKVLGNLDLQRFTLAMDSTRNSAGQIVCRSQLDPTTATTYVDDPFADARLPGDIAACVPLNPFGQGNITAAMRNYLIQDTTSVGEIEEFDVNAFVTGNSAALFSLPAGPIGVALGVEYRTEDSFFQAEDLVAVGLTFYNALPLFDPPTFEVKEVYSEIRVPLVKEVPVLEELTLSAAGRYSDYKGKTGGVLAYNYGLDWAPFQGLRFRAGQARAVRAPNQSDLYSAQGQNFATVNDPCSANFIGTGSATRAANCAAAGRPANYNYIYTATLEILSGGNPDLKEETSDSLTVGFVFQPTFLPGFNLSVDYFDITVDDVITAPTAQQILNACYDAVNIQNQFCALFQRAGAGGGPNGEEPFRVIEGSLQQTLLNYAKREARGVDVEAAYKFGLGSIGTLGTRLVWTHALARNDFLNPADPGRRDQILMELGDPKDAFNLDFDYALDKLSVHWQTRYISKMVLNFYEDTFSVQGRAPENADYADVRFYPEVWYHDFRVGYDVFDKVNVYAGIDNVFNRIPPYGLTGTGAGSAIYEPRGRFFYLGVKANF